MRNKVILSLLLVVAIVFCHSVAAYADTVVVDVGWVALPKKADSWVTFKIKFTHPKTKKPVAEKVFSNLDCNNPLNKNSSGITAINKYIGNSATILSRGFCPKKIIGRYNNVRNINILIFTRPK